MFLIAKPMTKLLRQHSGTAARAYADRTDKTKHMAFPSLLQLLWAATDKLEESMLPL